MDNIKKAGNDYEQHICQVISEMLGIKFKPTQRSGGALHSGDLRDWTNNTPLGKYCIELKFHKTQNSFNRDFRKDLKQAQTQTPANKNWMLITALPNTDTDLVVMDLKDFLCNETLSQMLMNKTQLKNLLNDCSKALSDLRANFEKLRGKL
jgi:hypothetical protein